MNRTTIYSRTLLCLLSFTLVSTPLVVDLIPQAEARAGRGSSMGSRGSRTYSAPSYTRTAPSGGQSMQRSMTRPPSTPTPSRPAPTSGGFNNTGPANRPAPPAQQPSAAGNFTRGLVGGAVGAAAYNMLAGGHKESNAQAPTNGQTQQQPENSNNQQQVARQDNNSFGGSLLFRLIAIGLVVWLVMRYLRRRRQNNSGNQGMNMGMNNNTMRQQPAQAQPTQQSNIQLSQDDYLAFQQRLLEVQEAWNRQDLGSLQKITTPEMLAYFNEQLTDLSSQGLHNSTSNVQFIEGDLSEAWAEGNREYATVAMRYSLIDITTDNTGRVVEGNPNQPITITELWTFVRAANNKWWLLSAIQQTN
ncbi:Tim44 domain-containing protein [Commensalibacter oyaizuii]|uniref:TIM44-like domain-containing protein n=1 Tax=Commensalibacter oyaizuii TaxID=3043873 RepID=A0ABT6PYR9_9PROT|nr:TIM44-like domain-containing protein [Commensalibacter sp. TBRC 16381]MDI2089998.1 TIM44-like domain-containing protein [Commensalibacter sp. TBRC 16381]